MRLSIRPALLLGLLASLVAPAALRAEPSRARLGQKVPDLVFRDEAGKDHRLYDLKDQKAIALVFLSFECPVSNSYSQPLTDLVKEMSKYGVTVWGLTVNEDDSRARVAKYAREYRL